MTQSHSYLYSSKRENDCKKKTGRRYGAFCATYRIDIIEVGRFPSSATRDTMIRTKNGRRKRARSGGGRRGEEMKKKDEPLLEARIMNKENHRFRRKAW